MTQQYPVLYPASAPRPLLLPELITIAVNVMILIALASWIFSETKKALRGEEVALPPLWGGKK